MRKSKRAQPAEEYKPRWDKRDDIFEVMSDIFGQSTAVDQSSPLTSEVTGPITPKSDPASSEEAGPIPSRVVEPTPINSKSTRTGWHRASDIAPALIEKVLGGAGVATEVTAPVTRKPLTSEVTGTAAGPPQTTSKGVRSAPKPQRARTVQDGHSMAEQVIYDTLWREARVIKDQYREITVGYRHLADRARLHRNTIDRNLVSLQSKFAIEIIAPEDRAANIGRTYRVYCFRNILERREAAGLIWYAKDRSGVRLMQESDVNPVPSNVTGPITSERRGPLTSEVTSPHTSDTTGPITIERIPPVITEVTNLKEEEGILLATSSSSAVAIALKDEIGYVDDEAIRRIVEDCRRRAPDSTFEEIANFARMTARRIRSMRSLQNPIGLLIRYRNASRASRSERIARRNAHG
jgi:hypothetical protein